MKSAIPADLLARNPLITPRAAKMLRDLREHEDAPRWTYVCGDRLTREDVEAIDAFRGELARSRKPSEGPSPTVVAQVASWLPRVARYRRTVPREIDLARDWADLPTIAREDLATRPGDFMPDDADMKRLIVHTTSGTTGHALLVPHHPRAGSMYKPLIEVALASRGVRPKFTDEVVGAMLLGAQATTATYATVHAAWANSGFAKLNFARADWPSAGSASRYIGHFAPLLLTGDPISFAEALRLEIPVRPLAMISTAVAMSDGLRRKLEKAFGCPVIDWYSLNETGPVAYACAKGAWHVLSHDMHVEVIDGRGRPTAKRGEIAVTVGRNPMLPLLRYRTGDRARLERRPCACGDPMPRLAELEGREAVAFRAADGGAVIPVDVSRVVRRFPVVQHAFEQKAGGACALRVRPVPGERPDLARLRAELEELFGRGARIDVALDARLGAGGRKVVAYRSAFRAEA